MVYKIFTGLAKIPKDSATAFDYPKHNWPPQSAIDGRYDLTMGKGKTCSHTAHAKNAYWEADFKRKMIVHSVVIFNRMDPCCSNRLNNAEVLVVDGDRNQVCGNVGNMKNVKTRTVVCPEWFVGNKIKVKMDHGTIVICEIDVIGGFMIYEVCSLI